MFIKSDVFTVLAVTAGLVLAPAAHAQWVLKQDTALYIGAAVGQTRDTEGCGPVIALGFTACDDKATAWKLHGGYQFNQNFGVELGYVNFGKLEATGPGVTASVKAWALELLGIASLPLSQEFSLYGKAGIFRWDLDGEVAGGGLVFRASDKGTDFTFGFGASYAFNPNLAARLEWQRYLDLDADVISLGLVYKFR